MRGQDLGLLLLGAATAALAWFTYDQVVGHTPEPVMIGTSDSGAATAGAEGAGTSSPGGDEDGATATSAPERSKGLVRAAEALAGEGEEAVVAAVLGDSTGDEPGEWVHLWAESLAEGRRVSYLGWDGQAGIYGKPEVLAEGGEGAPLTIYNGSQPGAQAAYPSERAGAMLPEQPAVVLLSFGHNNVVDDVEEQLDATLAAVRATAGEDVRVVVLLQQPQMEDANSDVRELVARWAGDHDLPTIDVAEAFLATDEPGDLLADELHPNEDGSALWADVVGDALATP